MDHWQNLGAHHFYDSLLHLKSHPISISNLNLNGLFLMERGKRDIENEINDGDFREEIALQVQ